MKLRQTTLASEIQEPLAIEDLRAHLNIEHNDFDSYLRIIMTAARANAEAYIDGLIADRNFEYLLDNFSEEISLPVRPVDESSIAIEYVDPDGATQTLESFAVNSNFVKTTIKPAYGESWPNIEAGYEKVKITFTAGYLAASGDVPADMEVAMLMIAATLFDQREDHAANVKLNTVPTSSKMLLDTYKLVQV